MRNGKRLLAGILATMTVFTSIPVQAVDISVPSTLNADQVTYNTNFNITVIAQEYTDDTFTTVASNGAGGDVAPLLYSTNKTYTCHSGDDAKANFDVDISDLMNQLQSYTANGTYKLGITRVEPAYVNGVNYYDGSGVVLNGSSLSITNLSGYDDAYNTNSQNYTDYKGNLKVTVTIPYCLTDKAVDPNFKGTYNHGYINSVFHTYDLGIYNKYSQTFTMPTVNVKDNPTKIPLLLIEAGETPDSVKQELVWLETNYIGTSHLGYKTIDSGVDVDDTRFLDDFDTNPNPYIEREYTCDSRDLETLRKFNASVKNIDQCNNTNATGDFSEPLVLKVIGSDPVTIDGQYDNETLYTKYNVKIKATTQEAYHSWDDFLNSGGSFWSEGFGMTSSYMYLVQNSSYEKIVDYYNVYDGDKANAEFVTTIKNDAGVAPSTDVAGWVYQSSDSEVVEKTYTVNHTRVNRYYTKLQDKTFSYKLKYKAVYSDGSPAEGISLKGEVTGADGFISGVDTYDITLKNLIKKSDGSYQTVSGVTEYYTLSPNETDSVINFTGNGNNYSVKASWNVSDRTQTVTADGKPADVSHRFSTADRYDDAEIDREDDFTSVFVLNVGDKEDTDTVDIPIKVNYYYQENGVESLVTSENTTISASVKTANGNVIEAPSSYELRDYDITSGLQAVATNKGVDVDALSLVNCYAGDKNSLAPANNNQTQSVDMLTQTLLTTYKAPTYEEVITFTNLKGGAWIVNIILKSSNKVNVTVHYKDQQGNTLHADNKYQFVEGEAKTEYIVEAIKDYVPLGSIDGYIPYVGVVLMNASEKGTGTNGAYLNSSGAVNTTGNYELTVYYEYDPYVRIYNVINYDYENATYVGTANCNPNTSYYLSVGDYNKVDIRVNIGNDSIVVPKLADDSVSLKGYSLNKGNTYANTLDNNAMISTSTEDMDVYICYVTPAKLKVVDEFYKSDGTTLVSSTVRSEETYDAGYDYNVSALAYNKRGSYTNLFDEPSNKRGTLTSDTTVTFKYKANPSYIYVNDYYFDEDGNLIDDISGQRTKATVDLGDTYNYAPKTNVGYDLWEDCSIDTDDLYVKATPRAKWSGTVNERWTYINFCYKAKTTMYTLTVKDKYLDASGVEEKTDIRQVSSFAKNSKYSVSALNPDDYEVVGQTKYEGTLTKDTEVTFVYKKKLKDFTLTVRDKYLDENGVEEKTDIRPTQTIKENSTYSVDALNPDGYKVVGDKTKSGVATSDVTVEFVYQKKAFTITVKDKYLDSDGREEKVDTRLTESKGYGYTYSYNALSPDGYTVISQSAYTGTLTKDTDITFIYQKDKYYTVTVLDEYVSVDGDIQKTDTRLTTSKKMGENYSYDALTVDGYVVTSDSSYSGVVNSDITVKFVYREDAARFVTVKGYITYTDGTPIANKRIEIHSTPRYTVTDENGYYEIKNVEVGDHKFKIFADDVDTPLVTCDLSVTKPNEDTVKVTFKTEDCEVETDTSVTDILKIDAILPLYKITVKDEYYDGTTLEKSVLRVEKTVKSGDNYSFEALNPDGYTVTSALKYEGVAVSNLDLVFKYTKKVTPPAPEPEKPTPTPEPTKYNVKVIDTYYSASMALIKSEVRVSDTVVENTSYKYEALSPTGFTVTSDTSYSGVVTKDLVLIFTYKENEKVVEPNKYNLKVVDSYYDTDGNFESSNVRESKVVTEGTSYLYKALSPAKYNVTGATSYNGQVIADTVLEFKYQAVKTPEKPKPEPEKPTPTPEEPTPDLKEYTVTVIDKYIVGVKNVYSDSVFGGLTDSSNVTIQKIEGSDDYIVTVERVVRCKDVYKEGATYSYNAEATLGFTIISDKAYSGVVTKDITLEFIYAKGFDSPEDIPEEIIDADPTPVVPFDEPKTGDSSVPVLPIIFFTAIIFVAYKKRKRV